LSGDPFASKFLSGVGEIMSVKRRVGFAGLACLAAVLSLAAGLLYGTPRSGTSIERGFALPVLPVIGGCPKCHQTDQVIPIMYGFPMERAMKEYNEGKVYLGGCVISADSPSKFCKRCSVTF
jgi:hypothetical protein